MKPSKQEHWNVPRPVLVQLAYSLQLFIPRQALISTREGMLMIRVSNFTFRCRKASKFIQCRLTLSLWYTHHQGEPQQQWLTLNSYIHMPHVLKHLLCLSLPTQVELSFISSNPGLHWHSYPPIVFVQLSEQLPLLTWHSSISIDQYRVKYSVKIAGVIVRCMYGNKNWCNKLKALVWIIFVWHNWLR